MAAQKKVLLALNQDALVWPGFLQGVRNYSMLHPEVVTHVQLFLGDVVSDRRMFRTLLHHSRPDGVLARVYWPASEQPLPSGTALVNMDDEMQTRRPTVMNDQVGAGRLAAEHLLEQKVPHFAYAAPSLASYGARLRRQGFLQRLREAGCGPAFVGDRPQAPKENAISDEALLAWVAKLPKPVGIHAYSLSLAARLAWACREGGLNIPGDVAILGGMDNPVLATALDPSISAIAFDEVRLGYESLQLLDRLMRGGKVPSQPCLIAPLRVVPRMSTDMQSTQDSEMGRVRQWIRENVHHPFTIKDLLSQTALSRRTLERHFTALTGHSLHEEIQSMRMKRVQALLLETTLPLKQVALQSGYSNYVTFSLAFRRFASTTASAFRQRATLPTNW